MTGTLKSPIVSIVVPVYNAQTYLRETLDSLLAQTYVQMEVVCVNDGSTDSSLSILVEYAQRDPRIRIIDKDNEGVSAARNAGILEVRGEYITFVDADDVVDGKWVEIGVSLMERTAADVVQLGYSCWNGGPRGPVCEDLNLELINGRNDILAWGWRGFRRQGFVWRLFYRKTVVASNFPKDVELAGDSLWALSMIGKCKSACCADYRGYWYRQTAGSSVRRRRSSISALSYMRTIVEIFQDQIRLTNDSRSQYVMREELARGVWFALYTWASAARDKRFANEIRNAFVRARCMAGVRVPMWSLGVSWLYAKTGWLMPIRLTVFLAETVAKVARM